MPQVESTDKPTDWITTAQAAQILGKTPRRILQLINEGELVGYQASPKLWLVKRSSVDEYQQKSSK